MQGHLSNFLLSLVPPKTITSCTADDVIKFLISRDHGDKTVVHGPSCPREHCACPRRLAAGTVDSSLGKIRAIFNNVGWTNDSNPVSHPRVKDYLKFVREEQAALSPLRRRYPFSLPSSSVWYPISGTSSFVQASVSLTNT